MDIAEDSEERVEWTGKHRAGVDRGSASTPTAPKRVRGVRVDAPANSVTDGPLTRVALPKAATAG